MAQPIKYNTGTTKTAGCCIRKGNFEIGVVTNREYGPTSTTGFWSGYNVPSGGFVSFQNKTAQGPSIYSISGVTELVKYGENLNLGGVYDTPEAVIQRCAELNTIVMTNIEYPEIPSIDNCVLLMDFGYTASYPWTGNTIYDISGGEVSGGTSYTELTWGTGDTINYSDSYFTTAGLENWIIIPPFSDVLNTFTINVWVRTNTFNNPNSNLLSQRYSQDLGFTPETDCNFFIRTNPNGDGYQGGFRISNQDYVVDTGTFPSSVWDNITLTYNGNTLTMYVNGVVTEENVTGISPLLTNGLDTLLGGSTNGLPGNDSSDYFNGRINVFHIYNTALNDTQVSELYTAYSSRFTV
jgi:hypothetical protein